jgi:hypothetical protein
LSGDFAHDAKFASGTEVEVEPAQPPRLFEVTIRYREPQFEARNGRIGHAFNSIYRIVARDREAALRIAIAQFEEIARQSQVRWRRDIVGVEAEPLVDADPAPR